MKFQTDAVPMPEAKATVEVGDVYKARGGRGTSAYVVAAITASGNTCYCLAIGSTGEIVGVTQYQYCALRYRPLLGRCEALAELELTIVPEEEGAER